MNPQTETDDEDEDEDEDEPSCCTQDDREPPDPRDRPIQPYLYLAEWNEPWR